jgi:FtsX-like permease family
VNDSDVMVDVPGPILPVIRAIEHAPGTLSGAAWIGVGADPVIRGKVDYSFLTNALTGSLDGEFYRQDKVTVLAGKLPPPSATGDIMLTQSEADAFRAQGARFRVGDRMTWQLYRQEPTWPAPRPAGRVTFRIAAIVSISPALVDRYDDTAAALLTPAATERILSFPESKGFEWAFGWAALRLRDGDAGVGALRGWLHSYGTEVSKKLGFPVTLTIRQLAVVQHEAQQAIEPQALALAVLGGLAALALIVLMAQGLAQLLSRSAADAPTLRALGASRATVAAAAGAGGAVAVVVALLLSVAGAIAVSPLAPVGPVRNYDPARGVQADWLVLGGGGAVLLVILLALLGWLAGRAVRPSLELPAARASALVATASRAALPVTLVTGIRHALERGPGRIRAPVLATLTGSVVAVAALAAALVFGASLTALTGHPDRYGYTWNLLVESSGGWGSWPTGHLDPLSDIEPGDPFYDPGHIVASQPGLLGWSELGFAQLTIHGTEVPVMGLLSHPGRPVEPPTTSGHPLTGQNQIEFGTVTMRQLGLHIGERIRIGADRVPVTVVGTVTLPSFGVVLTDHVSLGRGAMTDERTLLAILDLPWNPTAPEYQNSIATPAYPAAVAFDVRSRADAQALARRIVRWADSTPENAGTYYQLAAEPGAQVLDVSAMGSQPLTLAIGVAIASVLALALTILASVRERRRDLALLKALGLRSRQLRAVVAGQTTTILLIAIAVGVPLGIAAGNWTWTRFANSIGVVPQPVIPGAALAGGIAALLVAGNLLALWPAQVAARIGPAATFRTE